MNCKNCGADITNKNFCSQCGAPVWMQRYKQPYQQQFHQNYQQTQQEQQYYTEPLRYVVPTQQMESPTPILVLGILSLVFSWIGVGLIPAIIGMTKAKNYIASYGDVSMQVRIGKRLALAGTIASAVAIVLWIFYFVFIVAFVSQYTTGYIY